MRKNPNTIYKEYLKNLNIPEFNEMQAAVIEKANSVNNLMLLAPTGSGKTLAFLIPLINDLRTDAAGVQALIVVPSRELALKIEQVFNLMKISYKVSSCYE